MKKLILLFMIIMLAGSVSAEYFYTFVHFEEETSVPFEVHYRIDNVNTKEA